jgi:hypothetical protein
VKGHNAHVTLGHIGAAVEGVQEVIEVVVGSRVAAADSEVVGVVVSSFLEVQ